MDLNKYKELHELAKDIAKVVVEREETAQVKEYFSHEQNIAAMKKRLEDVGTMEHIFSEVEKHDKEAAIKKLEMRITQSQEHRVKRKRFVLKVASVSVAAALMVLSFIVYRGGENEVVGIVPDSVKSTKNEGVRIIHANGQIEVLAANKRIAINGVDVAQVDGDRLKYNQGVIDSAVVSTIVIPKASRYTVVLEDGTEVYLSANSTLKYPSKFIGASRDVELTGEAYFKVSKNKKPFNVKVLGLEVRVYGTEFNINSYNKNKIATTLLSGSVGVRYSVNNTTQEIKIVPNQRLTVNGDGSTVLDKNINNRKYMSWRDGFFRSDEEPLIDLLEQISFWYDVEFVFENESVGEKLISASLDSAMPVDSLIEMLKISTKIMIVKEGGKYIVR